MSLAFSTLVIALYALMPGFFLEHFLYSGKMARARAATPTLTDLAASVALSIPVHILTLSLLYWRGWMRAGVDYSIFVHAIAGQFGEKGEILDTLGLVLQQYRTEIGLYLLATALIALVLGQGIQLLLLWIPALERLLPFRNRWFYTFFSPYDLGRISVCHAYVLTKASTESRLLLYQGDVVDFSSSSDHVLTELRLRLPQRAFLKLHPPPPSKPSLFEKLERRLLGDPAPQLTGAGDEVEWLPLEQDLLWLPGDQITNMSLQYLVFWRPLIIVARSVLRLPEGSASASVDLWKESAPWRLILLRLWRGLFHVPRSQGIFVIPRADVLAGLRVEIHHYRVTITREPTQPLAAAEFQVVAVWQAAEDSRADKAGNLFFGLTQFLLRHWGNVVSRRARTWH